MRISQSSAPILLTDVVRELRQVDGVIWHVDRQEAGTFLRLAIGKDNVRVLVPAPGKRQQCTDIQEKGIPFHVIENLVTLRDWLQSLVSTSCSSDSDLTTKKG